MRRAGAAGGCAIASTLKWDAESASSVVSDLNSANSEVSGSWGAIRVRLVDVGGNTGGVGASVDCVRSAADSARVGEEHVIGRCVDTADRQGQRQQHPEVLVTISHQFPKKVT